MGLRTQRLRRPAYCIHSGARSHHRIPLFSRQVHNSFSHLIYPRECFLT